MFKRLFSKKSGFTLVEIIIAFVVFALFATMIMQILNMVSLERKSNAQFSDKIDMQEVDLLTRDLFEYDEDAEDTGTFEMELGGKKMSYAYQMYGAKYYDDPNDETTVHDDGSVNGLVYFVAAKSEPVTDPDAGDTEDTPPDEGNDEGAQTDRVSARITGTRGFDYISVNQVVKIGTDADGNTVYALDISASARNMNTDDIPYAAYRLYFLNSSKKACNIVYANYLNDQYGDLTSVAANADAKKAINSGTGGVTGSPDNANRYTVALVSGNGIRVGSPFKGGSTQNNNTTGIRARCTRCGRTMYQNAWGGWNYEDNNQGVGGCSNPDPDAPNPYYDLCTNHIQYLEAEPEPPQPEDTPYTGNGEKFYDSIGYHTRIEVAFKTDPGLTVSSFGQNGVMQADGSCHYGPNATIGDVEDVGPNIYGAYPK